MAFVFYATAALFLLWTLSTLWQLRWVRRLPDLNSLPALTADVRCSVIIAGRNEEARIEQTLRCLLVQRGVELEIIVVDDRSTDGTSEIVQRLANDDPRVRLKRVDVLPDGWLGKCHACHVGASAATGGWILFTDADCWLKADVIERALRVAECERADHITLSPGTVIESRAAASWHLMFLISISGWFARANRDIRNSYVGMGAFNLVRADAYRSSGGYEALRLTVLDDVKLGLVLRRAGKRTRAFLGGDDVECHWGGTVGSMIRIMEKNYFAALDYRLEVVVAGSLFVCSIAAIVVAGLISGTAAGLAAAVSPLLLILPGSVLARRLRWPWLSAAGTPLMLPVFFYTLLNSTFVTLRNGGVRWRETFYPLKTLRDNNVR
jgi:cellulose synthase/poly-beta-1,6-N-acetylglucosamine synthase-like glycosyltransferase